jgi:hypothetical protein
MLRHFALLSIAPSRMSVKRNSANRVSPSGQQLAALRILPRRAIKFRSAKSVAPQNLLC